MKNYLCLRGDDYSLSSYLNEVDTKCAERKDVKIFFVSVFEFGDDGFICDHTPYRAIQDFNAEKALYKIESHLSDIQKLVKNLLDKITFVNYDTWTRLINSC